MTLDDRRKDIPQTDFMWRVALTFVQDSPIFGGKKWDQSTWNLENKRKKKTKKEKKKKLLLLLLYCTI